MRSQLPLISAVAVAALAVALQITTPAAAAELTKEEKIARAESAAPPAVAKDATIVDVDGTVLRKGSNGWTCQPGLGAGDDHPVCVDDVWKKLMTALGSKAPFQTDRIGISYMLQGDMKVNNADPFDTKEDAGEVWVEEGPHLMIIVPTEQLEGLSDDPTTGGPYVMWKGTPYAHIMVPTAPRDGHE